MPFLTPFVGEGSPTKIDYRKKGYPFSSLSTGRPRSYFSFRVGFNFNFFGTVGIGDVVFGGGLGKPIFLRFPELKESGSGQAEPLDASRNANKVRESCAFQLQGASALVFIGRG